MDSLEIKYESVEHESLFKSNKECDKFNGVKILDIKNLFLKGNKGKQHYLVVMPYDKQISINDLASKLKVKNLSFASESRLMKYLAVVSGAVSIFGVLNDINNEVIIVIDKEVVEAETVGFHPNIDTETLIISREDFKKYLESLKNKIEYVTLF